MVGCDGHHPELEGRVGSLVPFQLGEQSCVDSRGQGKRNTDSTCWAIGLSEGQVFRTSSCASSLGPVLNFRLSSWCGSCFNFGVPILHPTTTDWWRDSLTLLLAACS